MESPVHIERMGRLRERSRTPPFVLALLSFSFSPLFAVSADWQSAVREQIVDSEYEVTWQGETALEDLESSWQAPNRAHGFRTYFTADGVRVIPRGETEAGAEPSWEWSLRLARWGRAGAAGEELGPGRLWVEGNRVEYDRGALVESWVNERRGLKQGFTIEKAPLSEGGFVHLDLALGGTLSPVVSEDGQAIDFQTPAGAKVVHYAELRVEDAGGRVLRSWMEGFSEAGQRGIRIVYEDLGAAYPVTIDPLATSPAWTAESNQLLADFGVSVATAGDVNADGYSDVIVGADRYDNGEGDEGRAFVYHGSAAGLETSPAWTAECDQASSGFGISVATAGDVNGDGYSDVVVGAHQYDNGQTDEGRAFVYRGSAAGLQTSVAWTAESDQAGAAFGFAVATAGDVNGDGYSDVIAGAHLYDNGQTDEGRAFAYRGSATGLAPSAAWTAEGDQASANFGVSVATAGDVDGDGFADVLVGADGYDSGQSNEGRAFAYRGSSAGLGTSPTWTAESDQLEASFGVSVAAAGDVNGDGYADVLVGAHRYDNGENGEGRAFAYHGSAAGLAILPAWTAESNQVDANLGFSVAAAGDVNGDGYADVIAGARLYDNGATDEGRAFTYHGAAAGLQTSPAWTAESDHLNAHFGVSVAAAGDVNGDGFADVVVGAPFYDNGQTDEGRAFAYHGSVAGLQTCPAWTAEGDQDFAFFGFSVAAAGDVNGDGYSDVIVGAYLYDNGQEDEGSAFTYPGSAAGLQASPAWTGESDQARAQFGYSVSAAGDVNGDGYADVVVGAWQYDNGQADEGGAFTYHGSAAGLATSPASKAESEQASAFFGSTVATAGDVNGDGYSDVIVGADRHDNGQLDEGCAFAYHGSEAGLATAPAWMAESNQAGALFGASVATAGDVNGDGYADVLVGAYRFDNGQADEGRAFAYHGSVAGLATSPAWTVESDQANANLGVSVATAGDVNGDGYADMIVGAHFYDNGQANEGRAFAYHGSAAGLATSPAWTAEINQAGATFSASVSTAGDVNGDGYADVVVGADGYDGGELDEGGGFVFYGNGGRGLSLNPRQRRGADAGPLAHLGVSDRPESFRLALLGRTPFGRGKVKLEWEVKPLGAPLNGLDTQTPVHSSDSGTSGVQLSHTVADLFEAEPYHWRVRLRYDLVTSPFAQRSRWLTVPWKGWQETMLRTADQSGAARVAGIVIDRAGGAKITLSWDASCLVTDIDYAIYEGSFSDFTSHELRYCGMGGATMKTFTPLAGDTYYLVVPLNATREGSYGKDSSDAERPPAEEACLPQQIGACP